MGAGAEGREKGGSRGDQVEVFEEGQGLISLGPPHVLGTKEVDERALILSRAACQRSMARSKAPRAPRYRHSWVPVMPACTEVNLHSGQAPGDKLNQGANTRE